MLLVTYGQKPFQWTIREKRMSAAWINRLANKISHVHADLLSFAMRDLAPILEAHSPKSRAGHS
ncbi:MAG: hypothetical protein ACLQF1_21315 [Methyloceanibacter sp.]